MYAHETLLDLSGWSYLLSESLFDPNRMVVVAALVLLSLVSFHITRLNVSNRIKLTSLYAHIIFLALIPVYLVYAWSCNSALMDCPHRLFIYATIPVFIGFFIAGLFVLPYIYSRFNSTRIVNKEILSIVKKYSEKLGMAEPAVYLTSSPRPEACTFTNIMPRIFISETMFRILNKKEIEAVLLHELAHVKNNSSLFKFSTILISYISPIARLGFNSYGLCNEENEADRLVIRLQKTTRYLKSAKVKVGRFSDQPKQIS
ncbi:M48 family metalloprotease [Candidatus Micrarchaeota archaeon]|nr:M48 family metalloprotease [Candidatus Micrarchaeota archaeon]